MKKKIYPLIHNWRNNSYKLYVFKYTMITPFYKEKIIHSKVFSTYQDVQKNKNNDVISTWNQCWIWKVLLLTGLYHKKYTSRFTYFLIKSLPFIFLHFRAVFSIFLLSRSGTLRNLRLQQLL